jgi:hypothetical protein
VPSPVPRSGRAPGRPAWSWVRSSGAIAGVLSGSAIDGNARREAVRKRALAAELGIEGREPGGPDVVRSPGVRRVYSAASLGVGILRERAPTEGPSQYPYD